MLQIISGKFYSSEDRYHTPCKAPLYSNVGITNHINRTTGTGYMVFMRVLYGLCDHVAGRLMILKGYICKELVPVECLTIGMPDGVDM